MYSTFVKFETCPDLGKTLELFVTSLNKDAGFNACIFFFVYFHHILGSG
jgi:hypothetical protein